MNITNDLIYTVPQELVEKFSELITVLQALGLVIIFYIIFNTINIIINRKKKKEISLINKNLEEIKKILKNKKK